MTTPGATPTTKPGDTPPADGTTVAPPATTGNTPATTDSQPVPTTGASTTAKMSTTSSSGQTTGMLYFLNLQLLNIIFIYNFFLNFYEMLSK